MTLIGVKEQTRSGTQAVMPDETAALAQLKLDVVYVVRPGERNENLRYSLRSLANLPHGKVYIAGYCPDWVEGVEVLYRDQVNQPDQQNSNLNLLHAATLPFLSDNFIFMNDDFMVMDPVEQLQAMHQGPLDKRIADYKVGNRYHQAYSLINTRGVLENILPGKELFSYELHMPMVMNKSRVVSMFDYWETTGKPIFSLRPRSFYGNLYQIKGVQTDDAKTSSWQEGQQSKFTSTISGSADAAADAERSDGLWRELKRRFNTASVYEAAGDGSRA